MIKLNNKNITYVALADSSNSLKAPKEIWYADSNNSVKLVYRRKDALIEGEDYEKYHFLAKYTKSLNANRIDNEAYIDTGIIFDDSIGFDTIINNENKVDCLLVGAQDWNNGSPLGLILYGVANPSVSDRIGHYLDFSTPPSSINSNFAEIENFGYNMPYYINGVAYNYSVTQITKRLNIYLFAINRDGNAMFKTHGFLYQSTPANIYIGKTTINQNDIPIRRFIPCKLLKPVPKWLDANGIRRQVGECGMIDLVSGKFYGNVNSVGTFTVENYYERKEWLVGDGDADISGTLICTDYLEWKLAQYSGQYVALNYGELSDNSHQFQLSVNSKATNKIGVFFNDTHNYVSLSQQSVNDIKFLVNSQIIGIINNVNIENNNSNLKFNGKISLNLIAKSGGISKITVDNKERYIPCTLTMDLPASMDANNIARTKGTSGMWDLVSDRFYGNVANSGTFKAVNLAEGVDYEVHQWLKVELVGTNASMMTLPVNSYSFAFSRKPLKGRNVPYFITEGNDVYLYSTTDDTIRIWNKTQYGYYYSGTSFNWGDTISIVSSGNGLEVNSQVIPQNTFPCKYVYFGANGVDGTENYTSSITVDGIERYIPVKLLKSIPSKYDANGIARQAGECGMYDTVNDKFYGNVASSGTFSVSDDE